MTYSLESITSQPPPQKSLVTLLPCCIYCISLYFYRLLIHIISIHRLFRVVLVKNLQVFFHGLKPGVSVFVSPEFPWIHRFTPLMEPGTERSVMRSGGSSSRNVINISSCITSDRGFLDFGSDFFFPATKNLGRKIMRDDGGRMGFRTSEKKGWYIHMGVSKNSGTPKWMVYNGKPY